jgi:hypothetical protein
MWPWEREMYSSKKELYMAMVKRNVYLQVEALYGYENEKCVPPRRSFIWPWERDMCSSKKKLYMAMGKRNVFLQEGDLYG